MLSGCLLIQQTGRQPENPHSRKNRHDRIHRTGLRTRNLHRPSRTKLPNPHPHPSRRHPQSPSRARPARRRANRHRQNRRLYAAQPRTPQTLRQRQRIARHAPRADAGAHAHARARRPNRPKHAKLHQKYAPAPHRAVWRRKHEQANRRFARRLRNRHRHRGAAA